MLLQHAAQRRGKLISHLREELQLSANLTQRLAKGGALQVNNAPARLYQKLEAGDLITVRLEEPLPGYAPEAGPLDILYEDEALIVLDKPAGLTMHPTSARSEGTLTGRVMAHYLESGQHCGIHFVSRLDRDTFGVVVCAKHAHIHALLSRGLEEGTFHKAYHALVYGCPEDEAGEICQPIGRVEGDPLLRCVRPDGQPSRSRYRVLERRGPCTLLALEPVTGRTNQLRVHCAWAGFPILGDGQYGSAVSQAFSLERGLVTQQLCAAQVSFAHPLTGEPLVLSSQQALSL